MKNVSVSRLFAGLEFGGVESAIRNLAKSWDSSTGEQLIEWIARRQVASRVVENGGSLRFAAKSAGLSLKHAYLAARSVVVRHRRRLSAEQRRNIRRDLTGDQQSLRQLAHKHGVAVETVRKMRIEFAHFAANTAVKRRCKSCGATITTHQCLRCSLKNDDSRKVCAGTCKEA